MTRGRKCVLGPDAVVVLERLGEVPWETARELQTSTGLPGDRIMAALARLKSLGLIDLTRATKGDVYTERRI